MLDTLLVQVSRLLNQLIGTLSPVNHSGLHQVSRERAWTVAEAPKSFTIHGSKKTNTSRRAAHRRSSRLGQFRLRSILSYVVDLQDWASLDYEACCCMSSTFKTGPVQITQHVVVHRRSSSLGQLRLRSMLYVVDLHDWASLDYKACCCTQLIFNTGPVQITKHVVVHR